MRDPRARTDGGPHERTDRVAAVADRLGEVRSRLREAGLVADDGPVEFRADDAPARAEFDEQDAFLQAAHAWATEEALAAASDLEHRTLQLERALEVYPGLGDDRPAADTSRAVVLEDLTAVAGAVERLVVAEARLARLEAAHTEA